MAIPDYQSMMLPLLRFVSDEKEHSLREATDALAQEFHLTEADLTEMLPSARKTRFYDRVGWARTYLRKAGLLSSSRRGRFQITQRGLDVLKHPPQRINVDFLEQFAEFIEFRTRREKNDEGMAAVIEVESQTPGEAIEAAYQNL
jgi:restriction system protein